jgi:hypothetical protein
MSRITVFTIPPRNASLESLYQSVGVGEGVYAFLALVMSMIALACFVVIAVNDSHTLRCNWARSHDFSGSPWNELPRGKPRGIEQQNPNTSHGKPRGIRPEKI